jgi:hypothetical protein
MSRGVGHQVTSLRRRTCKAAAGRALQQTKCGCGRAASAWAGYREKLNRRQEWHSRSAYYFLLLTPTTDSYYTTTIPQQLLKVKVVVGTYY